MKRAIIIMLSMCMVMFFGGVKSFAGCQPIDERPPTVNADTEMYGMGSDEVVKADKEKEAKPPPSVITKGYDKKIAPQCPVRLIESHEGNISTCKECHVVPTWEIKESPPDIRMDYPYGLVKIDKDLATYQIVGDIGLQSMEKLAEMFNYLEWHPCVKRVDIEILSGGGSLLLAWQMIAIIESYKSKYEITTKVPGFAASAAFLIFCAGENRLAYEYALIMHHELWTFSFYAFDDVSSSEEKARVMRLFQNNMHNYLVKRSILTNEQLDALIKGELDYWMTGSQAVEVGFATGLLK